MPGNKCHNVLFLLLVLSLLPAAHAQLAVSIQPADERGYFLEHEIRLFSVVIINTQTQTVYDHPFKILTSDTLVLLEEDRQTQEMVFSVPRILAGQRVEYRFWAQALDAAGEDAIISVSFGGDTYSEVAARQMQIQSSPVKTTLEFEHRTVALSQSNKMSVTLQNDSNRAIENLSVQLLLPDAFQPLSPHPQTPLRLDENETAGPLEFGFIPTGQVLGTHNVGVRIMFTDFDGVHTLEHTRPVSINDPGIVMALGALLLIAVIGALLLRSQKSGTTVVTKTTKTVTVEEKKT